MTLQQAERLLIKSLQDLYTSSEAGAIANNIMTELVQMPRIDRIRSGDQLLSEESERQWQEWTRRLLEGEPLQYVVGHAWFAGKKYIVSPATLIPRPETEELIQWIFEENEIREGDSVIDLGTGSGIIPIELSLHYPHASVYGLDISASALAVAKENNEQHQAHVRFIQKDIKELAQDSEWLQPKWKLIVSNPPYIPMEEYKKLDRNVLQYEPASALCVPDESPLLFYEWIADWAIQVLLQEGMVFLEIHQDFGMLTLSLFEQKGFRDVQLRQDMYGNDRMIAARK